MSKKLLDGDRVSELWSKIKETFKRTFIIDESLTMSDDDELSVTNPVNTVTSAEYDTLTSEERKGLYIIKNRNINLKDRGEIYSTEETVIGTWIDGKMIYRKTFFFDNISWGVGSFSIGTIEYMDTPIRYDGMVFQYDQHRWLPMTDTYFTLYISNVGEISMSINNANSKAGGKILASFEYTKTTDEAVIE